MNKILKEIRERRDREIKKLYRSGLSMDQICQVLGASKTTVFFAIRGRSKKSVDDTDRRRATRRELNKIINKNNHKNHDN